jgi:hypothetical protein
VTRAATQAMKLLPVVLVLRHSGQPGGPVRSQKQGYVGRLPNANRGVFGSGGEAGAVVGEGDEPDLEKLEEEGGEGGYLINMPA